MMPLTHAAFDQWLAAYGQTSADNDPLASAQLFAEDARYCERPFDQPLIGQQAIYDYWAAGAQKLSDKSSSYETLAVRGNLGIARWQACFVVKSTGAVMNLDCIFLAEFDERGLCSHFRVSARTTAEPKIRLIFRAVAHDLRSPITMKNGSVQQITQRT